MFKLSKNKILFFSFIFLFIKLHSEIITPENAIKPNSTYQKYFNSEICGYIKDYISENLYKFGLVNKEYEFIIELENITTPLQFLPNKKHPITGQWDHRIILDDKLNLVFNMTFVAQYNHPPKRIPRIMGTTKASLILEQDVLRNIQILSCNHIKENNKAEFYDTFMVIDSYEIDPPKSRYKKEAYYEKWIVQVCGITLPFMIEFIPDGKGGSYFNVFDLSNMKLPE